MNSVLLEKLVHSLAFNDPEFDSVCKICSILVVQWLVISAFESNAHSFFSS